MDCIPRWQGLVERFLSRAVRRLHPWPASVHEGSAISFRAMDSRYRRSPGTTHLPLQRCHAQFYVTVISPFILHPSQIKVSQKSKKSCNISLLAVTLENIGHQLWGGAHGKHWTVSL